MPALDRHKQPSYTQAMQNTSLRTFLACPISNENLSCIQRLQSELISVSPPMLTWVKPAHMHLTLKFMGEFNPAHLQPLRERLARSLDVKESFQVKIAGLGAFPSSARARVLWVGLQQAAKLGDLAKLVEIETQALGYPAEERPFAGHITLARVKPDAHAQELSAIRALVDQKSAIEVGSQIVEELIFWHSQLTPQGPQYRELFRLALKAS